MTGPCPWLRVDRGGFGGAISGYGGDLGAGGAELQGEGASCKGPKVKTNPVSEDWPAGGWWESHRAPEQRVVWSHADLSMGGGGN